MKTKVAMKQSFGSVLLAIVLGMVLLLPLAGTASADPTTPITVGSGSYVKSGTYVYYVYGHYNNIFVLPYLFYIDI